MTYLAIEKQLTQTEINTFHSLTNGGKVLWNKKGSASNKWCAMIKFYGAADIELVKKVFNVTKVINA